jgi:hypothetical protein
LQIGQITEFSDIWELHFLHRSIIKELEGSYEFKFIRTQKIRD